MVPLCITSKSHIFLILRNPRLAQCLHINNYDTMMRVVAGTGTIPPAPVNWTALEFDLWTHWWVTDGDDDERGPGVGEVSNIS